MNNIKASPFEVVVSWLVNYSFTPATVQYLPQYARHISDDRNVVDSPLSLTRLQKSRLDSLKLNVG